MLILRGPAAASQIVQPAIRKLVEQRFAQVCAGEAYDYDVHGYMVVCEAGESVEQLEAEIGCPIDFYEALEVHHDEQGNIFYEILFILNDSGFAVTAFVPEIEGQDAGLLALLRSEVEPATEHSER